MPKPGAATEAPSPSIFPITGWARTESLSSGEGVRTPLPRDVSSGDHLIARVFVHSPEVPGIYYSTPAVVQEGAQWIPDASDLSGAARGADHGLSRLRRRPRIHPEASFVSTMVLSVSVPEPLQTVRMMSRPRSRIVNGKLELRRPGGRTESFKMRMPEAGGWVTRRTLSRAAFRGLPVSR